MRGPPTTPRRRWRAGHAKVRCLLVLGASPRALRALSGATPLVRSRACGRAPPQKRPRTRVRCA
eukprot:2611786-Pyramimonas_sp.AAC.1